MNIPVTVRNYLANTGGQYRLYSATAGKTLAEVLREARVPVQKLLRSTLLKSGSNYLLAVYPASHRLELSVLQGSAKRPFLPCTLEDIQSKFPDCESLALPPLGNAYGLKMIIDRSVNELDEVFFTSGVAHLFLRSNQADFAQLVNGALRGYRISSPQSRAATPAVAKQQQMKNKVEQVRQLPPMPGIAAEILHLRNNPYINACELAAVIEQDPSLSAQLLRYATSPFYAYQGKVDSVETAIVRVLGLDFVMDFVFGLALGKSFRIPKDGVLGLDAFWRDALHVAALSQLLCESIEFSRRPASGMAYLSGLLHNFGFLLLAHLFPQQFARLNQAATRHSERPILELERELVGVNHTEMGIWLMDAWNMPREIIATVSGHHDHTARDTYGIYPNLVQLASRLLMRFGMGDAGTTEIPAELLAAVGLSDEQAELALAKVVQMQEGLQFMARKMVA